MRLKKFLDEAAPKFGASVIIPNKKDFTIDDIEKAEKESMLKAWKARPAYLKNTSMQDWLDYDKVEALPWTAEQHQKEAKRLKQEFPNSATPSGRIAHALARVHQKVSGSKIFKKTGKGVLSAISSTPLVQKLKSDASYVVWGKEF